MVENYPISNKIGIKLDPFYKIKLTDRNIIRCTQIQIYPTYKQRQILKKWFDWYRWAYNQTIMYLRSVDKLPSPTKTRNILKRKWKNDPKISHLLKISKIPSHTLSNAILDVAKAYKSAFTNIKRGYIKYFRMRPKKSKSPLQTISLESSVFSKKTNTFCTRALGKYIKTSKSIINIRKDCRLTWDKRSGKMILHVPTEFEVVKVIDRSSECSLDPGIRTFQTLYSQDGVAEFGINTSQKIKTLLNKVESKKKYEKEKWYKKFSRRIYAKIKHIVDDLHWKTAGILCEKYDTILLGNMSTKGIVRRGGNLNKNTRSVSMFMRHYTFRQRLISKGEELGADVKVVDEAYTSKTCGNCFEINHDLGSSKVFNCKHCGFNWGRDFNGARNIMLRYHGII